MISILETSARAFGVIPPDLKVEDDKELLAVIKAKAAAGDVLARDFITGHGVYFTPSREQPQAPALPTGIQPAPRIRNLIYHVCALQANNGWKDNLDELKKRIGLFNGKRVVAIARGPGIHDAGVVMREIPGCQYLVLPNDRELREVATFLPLLLSVANTNPEEATFYAHTKSNSTADGEKGAWAWSRMMYRELLDDPVAVMNDLRDHLAVGTTKAVWHGAPPPFPSGLTWAGWAFYGTFWWFRHDAVFTRPKWQCFPNDRYAAESFLGHLLPPERCKTRFQPWSLQQYPAPNPYDASLYPEPNAAAAPLPMISHRDEFPKLIDHLGLKTFVEVGAGAGDFSRVLLRSKLQKLYLVDPWPNPADAENKRKVYELAAEFPQRVQIVEATSVEAAKLFPPGSIDGAYIDAMHEYPAVKEDVDTWWRVVSKLLAGHDYVPWNSVVRCPCGVIPAIEEFAERHKLDVHVTGAIGDRVARLSVAWQANEGDPGVWGSNLPSWWILKT